MNFSAENFVSHLYIFAMFIPLVAIHEAAHAWVAHLLGDDTARDEGRLTLNPVPHIDPWGTLLIPGLNVLFGSAAGLIGWGKPVPVDPYNLRNPRRDEFLIALAGPAANIALAFPFVVVLLYAIPLDSRWYELVHKFAYVSIFLGLFNLFPIPPLDGWTILRNAFRLPPVPFQAGSIWGLLLWLALFWVLLPPALAIVDLLTYNILHAMALVASGGRL